MVVVKQALLAVYTLCGCDIADAMRGITHNAGLAVLARLCEEGRPEAERDVLVQLVSLGTQERLEERGIVVLEHFICKLYSVPQVRLDDARLGKMLSKKPDAFKMMSTSDAFQHRSKRAFYPVRSVVGVNFNLRTSAHPALGLGGAVTWHELF